MEEQKMASNLRLQNLFSDEEEIDATALPDYTTLDFVSKGSHIYGEIMWPSANQPTPHPCVIMMHGFPGTARNDDISHALFYLKHLLQVFAISYVRLENLHSQ